MSERGPKGDHGQHGDTGTRGVAGERGAQGAHGDTGAVGERGAHGDVGQSGQTGRRGQRGPSHWIAYVLMGVFVTIGFALFQGQVAEIDRLTRENAKAGVALCALRDDLQDRVDRSTKFLAENPAGIPGIPPKVIRDGITNQQRTIAALRSLDCS